MDRTGHYRCANCGDSDEFMLPGKGICIHCGPCCDGCGDSELFVGPINHSGFCATCQAAELAALKASLHAAIETVRAWVEGIAA